jgi:hypothetical protein
VHRKDTFGRQQVVERGEDRLLDLARVLGAADEHGVPAEVDQDEGLAVGSVAGRVGLHRREGHDGEIGLEFEQLVGCRPDEQVAREQAVPRELGDHANAKPVVRVGTGE